MSDEFRLSCRNAELSKRNFGDLSNSFCSIGQDFYNLFNSLQEFILVFDLNGMIFFYNKPFQNQLGYPDSYIKGRNIADFYPDNVKQELKSAIDAAINGTMSVSKIPLLNSNGCEIPFENRFVRSKWGVKDIIIVTFRDISETLKYEEQIRNSSERLEMVLLASDAGWWDWKVKTDDLTLNEKWCSMRGFKQDEIPPHVDSWKSLVHHEDLPRTLENLEKHFRNEEPFYQAEYRAKTKDGGYIWILDTGKVIEVDETGAPVRVVGTNINITAQKENEIKLQKNLRQQELLSEIALELNSLEGFETRINKVLLKVGIHTEVSRVYIFEDAENGAVTNNTFEWCNAGIEPQINELQGIPYEIIPSWKKTIAEDGRIYSENISELPDDVKAILEPQGIKSIIVYPLNVKGSFFGFIGFDECVRNKHWTKSELELLRTFSGIIANAYERSISEKSLQESESRNRALLESIPDILFLFNKNGDILSYKSSSVDELAFTPEQFINKNLREIFPEEFCKKVLDAIDNCLKNGSFRLDYILPVNGELNDYEARMARMNDNEVIAIVRNVSERKKYERELTEERDRANQANRAKSEFLANMSHEIRTPMNAILGFSEALYHKMESPQHQKMLKSILSSGNLLLSLLNDILDLSKIEAGMLEISPQPVDLGNIIQEIKILFLSKAEKKNVEINMRSSSNFPRFLMLDEIRIKQVIFNLVGNAIKFTHIGFVNIKTSFDSDGSEKGILHIDVEDTGIGIPLSQQQIIFETFRQQSGQSNRLYEGAGLGLAIAKRLVEKMSGEIYVKSEVGKGSVFSISIPCSLVESYEVSQDNIDDFDLGITFEPAQILVVDDVSSNIEAIESLLDGTEVKVLSAENGELALEILKNTKPDVVLLDLRMPVLNGYETARKIKEEMFTDLPLVAYTASVFGGETSLNEKFTDFLFKPVSKGALLRVLKKYINYRVTDYVVKDDKATLENLPPHVIENLPEIYEAILSNSYPQWLEIKDQLVLFKIEEFAVGLKKLAVNYGFEYLINYADNLKADLSVVDLESIMSRISEFPDIIKNISKLLKN